MWSSPFSLCDLGWEPIFNLWYYRGSETIKDGKPKLGKVGTILLPKIALGEKVGDYKTMVACVEWLWKLVGGTTWEAEIDAIIDEHCATIIISSTRLI